MGSSLDYKCIIGHPGGVSGCGVTLIVVSRWWWCFTKFIQYDECHQNKTTKVNCSRMNDHRTYSLFCWFVNETIKLIYLITLPNCLKDDVIIAM